MRDVSLAIATGEIVAIIGQKRRRQDDADEGDHRAAAAIARDDRVRGGEYLRRFPPMSAPRAGFGYFPQGRGIFPD